MLAMWRVKAGKVVYRFPCFGVLESSDDKAGNDNYVVFDRNDKAPLPKLPHMSA